MGMGSEMGLTYDEFCRMTWGEFRWRQVGYERRMERGWDYTRHLISSMYNSSGFVKKTVKASEVIKLPLLDEQVKRPSKKLDSKTIELMKSRIK